MVKWLITISGVGPFNKEDKVVSRQLELPEEETPVDWFLTYPSLNGGDFKVMALLNFWKIEED